MINNVVLIGRITKDPELRTTNSGTNVTSFCIAVDRSYVKVGEERQTDFITIVAWSKTAEFVCKNFYKGNFIGVEGSIQTRKFEDKNGENRTAVEVLANNVSFVGNKESSEKKEEHTNPISISAVDEELPF